MERLYLKNLHEVEFREQYRINISNRFAALENLKDSKNMSNVWENIKENTKSQIMSL
jgi:hypothetical protein